MVERPLSSGGMGAVYVAKHGDTGRAVALKVIKTESSAELEARFRKETGALARVSHPNVVTFLDSGVEDGTLFLVMELLAGTPLRSIMTGPVPWQRALRIGADVCRALLAVHEQGILHRDLKPENVFLVDAAGHDEIAKLIDFGIARLADRGTSTATGAVVGTPGYISPEQLAGHEATVASDVYAVGVLLYELVTGKFPFDATTTHAMLVKQLIEPLPPPKSIAPALPDHVERLILSFMERDPQLRVRTAKDALAALVDALGRPALSSLPASAATELGTPAPLVPRETRATPLPGGGRPLLGGGGPPVLGGGGPKHPPRVAAIVGVAVVVALVAIVVGILNLRGADRGERGGAGGAVGDGRARFVGNYNASYEGTYDVPLLATQHNTSVGTATIREGRTHDLQLTFIAGGGTRGVCEVTLNRTNRGAVYEPLEQSCSFINPDGSQQTNTNTGRAVMRNNNVVVDVEGTFVGTTPQRAPYGGTFRGTWILTRR